MLPELCAALILAGITAYAILAGADFGAGVWDLTAGGDQRGGRLRGMVERSMSPVWEANHVWLIFVLVIFWTAFPVAFGSVMSSLYIPMLLAALGIIFRGTAFALRGRAATMAEARTLGATFALASLLVPFWLGTVLGGIASGRVEVGNALADPWTVWLNPTGILIGVLAVLTGAYLAAVFMAADSVRAGVEDLQDAFRVRALGTGVVLGALALGGLLVLRSDARQLFDGLTSGGGLVMVLASAVAGGVTLWLVWSRRFEWARLSAAAAVSCITIGWALAQSPDMLPGQLTVDEAAASEPVLVAVLIATAVGALVLVPSLWYLYRLVLRGELDHAYEPLDQRYRPEAVSDRSPDP
jgi:cytochrome d ubiquinol oxidase subunit II